MAKQAKILLDSGASGSIVSKRFVTHFKQTNKEKCMWKTMAGSFMTSKQCMESCSEEWEVGNPIVFC